MKTFVSSVDIEAGAQWQSDILGELDASTFGIICVTRENQHKPWVNFEAGAIAKRVTESRCVPLALDLSPAEVERPLGMYQAKSADEPGVWALVEAINGALDEGLRPEKEELRKHFVAFWPELKEALSAAATPKRRAPTARTLVARSERRMIEEILTTVRAIAASQAERAPDAVSRPRLADSVVEAAYALLEDEGVRSPTAVALDSPGRGGEAGLVIENARPVLDYVREKIERRLLEELGISNVMWLTPGPPSAPLQ